MSMIIEKASAPKPTVPPVKLSQLKPRDVFHFSSDDLESVLGNSEDRASLYMVVDDPDRAKSGRVPVVCLIDAKILLRDDIHLVHKVEKVKMVVLTD